ncbi:MAG: Periplasmic copper-binding protein (NosD) [Methanomassiliicoccales archaeon PtaU1.Bin124]|nr:MAG: Periplasmic copper-binding protein (NosD) [Methanomassiliicoccales archaeon PtaU1.Bin124]
MQGSTVRALIQIRVNSDSELDAMVHSNGWNGTGTFRDPYMIENQKVIATGKGSGIFIGNVSSWVVVRNCTVTGAAYSTEPYGMGAGIFAYCSKNIVIERNNVSSNNLGIMATRSMNITIDKNNCSTNVAGVCLYTSWNSTISENRCVSDTYIGIYLFAGSSNNTINGNNCSISYKGISLEQKCNNNLIQFNNCSKCNKGDGTGAGIILAYSCCNNTVRYNTCNDSSGGIRAANRCNWNDINNNTCLRNVFGYMLDIYSINNSVADNVANFNMYGAIIWNTNDSVLRSNNFSSSQYCGIWFRASVINMMVVKNNCSENAEYGIKVDSGGIRSTFFNNILIGNNGAGTTYDAAHIQAYDLGTNNWNSTTEGNYWADWTTPDANSDGIVDNVYNIAGGSNHDHYPLIATSLPFVTILAPSAMSYTKSASVSISGIAAAYSGIDSINWYNKATGTEGACSGSTTWSATVPLVSGSNEISVNMTDGLGHKYFDSVIVVSDSSAPTLLINSPIDGSFNNTGIVNVHWTCSDTASGLDHFEVSIDSGAAILLDITSSEYQMSGLPDGVHTFEVTAVDRAGNLISQQISFTVETEGPIVIIAPSSPIYTNATHVEITIEVTSDIALISANSTQFQGGVLVNNLDLTSSYVGQTHVITEITVTVAQGHTVIFFRVNDSAGNYAVARQDIYCDLHDPNIEITSPMSGANLNSSSMIVRWEPGASYSGIAYFNISIDGAAPVKVSASTRSYEFTGLADGQHIVKVTAVSNARNSTTDEVSFTVDTVAPSLTILTPLNGTLFDQSTMTITWEAEANLASMHYRVDGLAWQALSNNAVSTTLEGLTDGPHRIEIKATDLAGNEAVRNVTIIIDTVAPTAVITPHTGLLNITTVFHIGFSEVMNETSIFVAIEGISGQMNSNDRNTTFVPIGLGYNQEYTMVIRGCDLAGNELSITWKFNTTQVAEMVGYLRDADGKAIANATLTLSNGASATTDANGYYVFHNVVVGNYSLTVHKDGYEDSTIPATVTKGGTSDLGTTTLTAIPTISDRGLDNTIFFYIGAVAVAGLVGTVLFLRMRRP